MGDASYRLGGVAVHPRPDRPRGPFLTGALSNTSSDEHGGESLRSSRWILAVGGNRWSALHDYLVARTVREAPESKFTVASTH